MSDGKQVDPTKLSVEQLVKLLSAAYRERINEEKVRRDLDGGAPTNADGTINLVHYTAWQAKEMSRGD
jgi:hypothetical protein